MKHQKTFRVLRLLFITLMTTFMVSSCGLLSQMGQQQETVRHERKKMELLLIASSDDIVNSYSFNSSTIKAEHTGSFATSSPSSIFLNRMDDVLYIANNLSEKATITAAQFNKQSGELSFLNQSYVVGKGPVAIDLFGDKVVSANEMDGSITLFQIDKINGSLSEADWRINLGDANTSSPSDVAFSKDGAHVYVVDKGQDKIFHFRVHSSTPPLSIDHRQISLPKDSKPIQLVFDNKGKFAYLLCEDDPNIYFFSFRNGDLELLNKFELGIPHGTKSTSIAIHPEGTFLYVTQSGSFNGLAIFSRNTTSGELKKLGTQKAVANPSRAILSPSGKFIAILGNIGVDIYQLNPSNGMLTKASTHISISKPTDMIWKSFLQ